MSQKSDRALSLFEEGHFCSQAVLAAFCDELDMPHQMALKIASGFGGGMGRMGGTCGAVTGAFIALGLTDWQADTATPEAKNHINERIRSFTERFKQKHGSIECQELLGCCIGEPQGFQEAVDKGVFVSVCRPLVTDAVEIVEDMIGSD